MKGWRIIMDDARNTIRKFIVQESMFKEDESILKFDDLLLEKGIIDSAGLVQLVAYLEREFSISIADNDILPENFETVGSISKLVDKSRNSS